MIFHVNLNDELRIDLGEVRREQKDIDEKYEKEYESRGLGWRSLKF